jgi:predicted metallo-beta-lactamase superfamily hydrolase
MDAEQRGGVMIPKLQTAVLNSSQKRRNYSMQRDTAESSTHEIFVESKPAKFCKTPIDLA